jgi:hypothetical protein
MENISEMHSANLLRAGRGTAFNVAGMGDQLALAAQHGVKFLTRTEVADYGFRDPKPWEAE